VEARWREFQTEECDNFGIETMLFLAPWLRLRNGSLLTHSLPVVFRRNSIGMRQFFIPAVHIGTIQLLLCSGTALSCELLTAWKNLLMSNGEG